MGMRLVAGRLIGHGDAADTLPVVVINQAMARRYWPHGEDPVGRRLQLHARADERHWTTIVGVVNDVRSFGLDAPPQAEMYFPFAQWPHSSSLALVLHTTSAPADMIAAVRAAIGEIDAGQPIYAVAPMRALVAGSLAQRRFALTLMLLFALVALRLAAVGIYGVMAYTVAQRTHELGIRMALGAGPADVMKMVSRTACVSATDGATYAALAAALGLVALAAVVIPARRATRVDPMLALRAD
jgi:putative ABC transport system permease protein